MNDKIFAPEFIPFYVDEVRRYKLSPTEGLVYWFIRFYTKLENNWFYFKSEHLARIIQVSEWTIDNCILKLKKLWLLKVETGHIWFKKVRKIFLNFDEIRTSSFDEVQDLIKWWTSISLNDEIKYNNINNNKKIIIKEKNIKKEKFWIEKNIFLTKEEFEKLWLLFSEKIRKEYIEKLSIYILQNPNKKYESHYLTIRKWLNKANIQPKENKEIIVWF